MPDCTQMHEYRNAAVFYFKEKKTDYKYGMAHKVYENKLQQDLIVQTVCTKMIVLVIKVNTFKGKQKTGLVNVELSTFNHRVTGIEVKFEFMQMEPMTDTVKSRRLQVFFVDTDGIKISFLVPITANIKSTDAKDRLIQEKFTLKSGRYSREQEYFLVIAD